MRDYNLRPGKKETCFMNFPFTMRDVFTKKKMKKKRKKGKKERRRRRKKKNSALLSIYSLRKTKCCTVIY